MIKQTIANVLKFSPSILLEHLGQWESMPKLRRLARLGLQNRDVNLRNGVGQGLKFNSSGSNPDFALGTYELPVQKVLLKYLNFGDIFYDIGASVGFFTVIAAKIVGSSGKIYAFEPAPDNVASIQRNIKLNHFSNVTVLEKAVSSSTHKGELQLGDSPGGHTLTSLGTFPGIKKIIPIDIVSIDDLLGKQILLPPNVVKIDVEGAEIDVLQGMSQTIDKFKPIIIYEIDDRKKESFLRKQEEVDSFVRAAGYEITPLEDSYPEIGWHVGHVVATPK